MLALGPDFASQGNVFIDDGGHAQVADFGITIVGDQTSGRMSTLTSTPGSVRWMAPERFGFGDDEQDEDQSDRLMPSVDVWAFGCLCLMVGPSFLDSQITGINPSC
jgi:serine/threonine protein kinase